MRGDDRILAILNQTLEAELTAIIQYIIHSRLCAHWGYGKLASIKRKEAIQEMSHAEALIERIAYFDGTPKVAEYTGLKLGATVKEQLANDLKLEVDGVALYNKAVKLAVDIGDNGSRDLFEHHLKDEEGHAEFLESQLRLIEQMGYENYLSTIGDG